MIEISHKDDQMKFNSILKIFGQLIGFVFLNVKSLKVTQLFTPPQKNSSAFPSLSYYDGNQG